MSQSIVNEVLAKKPKRRVEWVQKRLKEDLAITHRDSLYEVLVRKEGRAFAADISGADAVRTYNAVLAAIELFTTKQQRHLQADTFLLRKIHSQEQERHKAAQAKAKAAVKKPAKDRPSPSGLLQRPTAQKESPKMAQRPQSPDEPLPSARDPTFSPPRNSVPKERPRSASPDWIPRTPPQEPPQEPRKATGSWTTIFQSPPEDQEKQEKLSPPRTEAVTRHQGAKEETETKDSKPAKRDRDSSSSTEYDAFATGPEPVALQSPPRTRRKQSHESHKSRRSRQSRQSESSTGSADESVARPSGLVAQSVRPGSSGSPSLERKPAIDRKEVEIETSHNGNVSSTDKTRLPNAASATLHAQGGEGPDLPARTEKSPEVSKGESDNLPPECNGSGSDSDSDSSSSADDGKIEPAGAVPEEQKDLDEGSDSDDSESSEHEEQEDRAPEVPEVPPEVPEVPEVQSIPDGMTTEAAPDPVGKTPLPRRPPPPPPPARRRMAEADAFPRWRYIAPDGQERLAIRSSPGVDAPTTGGSLGSGEVFAVKEESPGANGVLFLRLADGRGWVFDRRSGLARRRRTRPLCVPYQVPLVDEEDLGKAKRSRPKAVGLPKAKRRRRRQAVIDPYMVTADIIQVDSDEDARLANPAAKASESDNTGNPPREAKENLRLQLEKKQREVQALRAKLSQLDAQKEPSRSQRLASADPKQVQGAGRWHKAEATDQMLDEKRRELQAMLAKKRAMSAARLQKTAPQYVD